MRNKMFTKITAAILAITMAFSPVTADAATKKVVTNADYLAKFDEIWGDPEEFHIGDELLAIHEQEYDYVKSLSGYYNASNYKVVTALEGTTKKLTSTGKYDVIVGGTTAKTDQGYIKFVAPATGTYKFTFTVKNTITNNSVYIQGIKSTATKVSDSKVNYTTLGGSKVTTSSQILLTPSGGCMIPASGSVADYLSGSLMSSMKTITATATMKKGQYVKLVCRSCGAAYNETDDEAYNFTDFNLKITKTK